MKRIPTLDGWRGIAILLVMIAHTQDSMLGYFIGGNAWMDVGQHGVNIFFVLSGYLITSLLLEEEKVNLRRFYLRRFFRLMPCAWTYLAFLGVLSLLIRQRLIGSDLWPCLFFFRNYLPAVETPANTLSLHFWSLSVEEQFYMAWPPLLLLAGRKWGLSIVTAGALACAAFRLINWNSYNNFPSCLHTEVRVDALLAGCALAFLMRYDPVREWIRRHGAKLFLLCLPAFLWHMYRFQLLIPLTESLLIALMIACTSVNPKSIPSRVLEWQHLKTTGIISYSIYVWQQVFLRSFWGPLGFPLLCIASIGSWILIEQPCIRLGRRLEQRISEGNL
jgi:peptidoglycan/LPS O-acetylase OafA/YrhL